MKITKDIYITVTAEAMSKDSTKKLFEAEPHAFDMFSMFAYAVFDKLDGKDVTEDGFTDIVTDVLVHGMPDKISDSTMIKQLALIIFSVQIWEQLEKLDKPNGNNLDKSDSNNPEYDSFKTELNSKLT